MRCSIIGAGNGGLAFAGLMGLRDFAEVTIYDVNEAVIGPLRQTMSVGLEDIDGKQQVRIAKVTDCPDEAVESADLVMVVTPASFHAAVAHSLGPYLKPGTIVVLNPGRTGGAMEFSRILSEMRRQKDIVVAEAQTLLFACRKTDAANVMVKGIKKEVPLAAISAQDTPKALALLNQFFPQFTKAQNVLETSLNNIGAIFHPTPTLLNAARIECGEKFQYYHEGITPAVAALLEQIDQERVKVAEAFQVKAQSALEWLNRSYGLAAKNLYDAIQANPSYRGIMAPTTIQVRYISEDVPTGLVPLAEFANLAGIAVPYIRSMIQLTAGMTGTDYSLSGRKLASMGIEGLSVQQIIEYVS